MDMRFGDRVQAERRRLNYTQKPFASATGIAPCTQADYEGDRRLPTIDYLARAAQLGVDVQFVVLGRRAPNTARERAGAPAFRSPTPALILSSAHKNRPLRIG